MFIQIAIIFWDKPNKIGIVGTTNAIIWLSIIWPIVSCRFPRFTRWVFVCFHLTTTVMILIIQWTKDEDSILYEKKGYGEFFPQITILYVFMVLTSFNYCEFNLSLFFYAPCYVLTCALSAFLQRDEIKMAHA